MGYFLDRQSAIGAQADFDVAACRRELSHQCALEVGPLVGRRHEFFLVAAKGIPWHDLIVALQFPALWAFAVDANPILIRGEHAGWILRFGRMDWRQDAAGNGRGHYKEDQQDETDIDERN